MRSVFDRIHPQQHPPPSTLSCSAPSPIKSPPTGPKPASAAREASTADGLVGALFGFAYPRRPILACCIVFGGAALLETLQTLTPDRHGTLADAVEKMAGGASGIYLARRIQHFWIDKGWTTLNRHEVRK